MRVEPVNDKLVRVDGWFCERYAVPGVAGRWTWDHTGRAVCPVTQAEIDKARRR